MANNLTGNVWHIDTASSDPVYGTSATPATQQVLVSSITWSGYSDATHTVVIEDENDVVHTFNGATQFEPQEWSPASPVWLTGLKVTTLGSGVVNVAVA